MASKTPILASNIGSITEVLNKKNSFLFDPENLDDLINKIKFIKVNYKKAQDKANNAFEDVKGYTWQKRVGKILEFLTL